MAIEKKEVSYAKELDDCMVLVVELIKDIKAKKGVSELMSENLGNLIAAIGGIDQVAGELESNKEVALETIGFRVGELSNALLAKSPQA